MNDLGKIEVRVSRIWEEALNSNEFNREDSLFEVGGNSLIAMMILNGIENEFGVTIDVAELMELNTIEKQVEKIGCLLEEVR